MHKKILLICVILLTVIGCNKVVETNGYDKYEQYYKLVDQNTIFENDSEYFTTTVEITTLPSDEYRYYVFIDEPKTAMYNCVVLVRQDEKTFDLQDKMVPTMGIFDRQYNLVPNQVNTQEGYPKGLVVSGECDNPEELILDILVEWTNKEGSEVNQAFIKYSESEKEG